MSSTAKPWRMCVVKDGETIVIGGILKDTSQDSESGVPYLKDIPVMGWLFKSHRVEKDFEELDGFHYPTYCCWRI